MLTIFTLSPSQIRRTSRGADDQKFFSLRRLSIFQQLSTGRQVSSSRRYVIQHFHFTRYATNYILQLTNQILFDVPNIIAVIYYLTYLIPRHNMTSKLFLFSGMAHDGITRQMQIERSSQCRKLKSLLSNKHYSH